MSDAADHAAKLPDDFDIVELITVPWVWVGLAFVGGAIIVGGIVLLVGRSDTEQTE